MWFLDRLLAALQAAWCWLINLLFDGAIVILQGLLEALPPASGLPISAGVEFLKIVNSWFPIPFAVALWVGYNLFLVSFICFKFILKLIPTIG